jgi:uncharacterized protein YjbI with pentapeptide repeats
VAQAQKAEAFTPSGRLQRQGFKNEAQVKLAIKAIETHLENFEKDTETELWSRLVEVFRDVFREFFPRAPHRKHRQNLERQLQILNGQLDSRNYTGEGAYLMGLDLQGADLQGAVLQGAQLQGAQLQGAQLQGAQLQEAQLQLAQLQGAQLQEAKLQGAKLKDANLQGAQLQEAQLQLAQLQGAQLQEAQLQGADLQEAQLQLAGLQGADLQGARLQEADLYGANLDGADLDGAELVGARLVDAFGVPKNINTTMLPQLQNTILESCITLHQLSILAPTGDGINDTRTYRRLMLDRSVLNHLRLEIIKLEQERQKNFRPSRGLR